MATLEAPMMEACIEQLKHILEPNLDAFILKIELEILTLIIHPETSKIRAILPLNIKDYEVEICNFLMWCNQSSGKLNLSFQLRQIESDGFVQVSNHQYQEVPLKLHQIRAIV